MNELDTYRHNVEDVLRNSVYRKCDSSGARNEIVERLRFPGLGILLCQYRPCNESTIESLKTGSILFKSPLQFNDPFDSLMYWNQSRLDRYFHEEPYKSVLEKFHLWDAIFVARKISNCLRVSCFSEVEVIDSPLMWAHYAHDGAGYCVVYELHPSFNDILCLKNGLACRIGPQCPSGGDMCLSRVECSMFPVVYSEERLDATENLAREIEYMVAHELHRDDKLDLNRYDSLEPYKTALFKSHNWFYEHEWRLMISGVMSSDRNHYIYEDQRLMIVSGNAASPPLSRSGEVPVVVTGNVRSSNAVVQNALVAKDPYLRRLKDALPKSIRTEVVEQYNALSERLRPQFVEAIETVRNALRADLLRHTISVLCANPNIALDKTKTVTPLSEVVDGASRLIESVGKVKQNP